MSFSLKKKTSEKKQFIVLLTILLIGIGFIIGYIVYISSISWNDYWFKRFDDGQCRKICESKDMVLGSESPSECQCIFDETGIITFKRPYTFADNIQILFGGR